MLQIIAGFVMWSITLFWIGVQYGMHIQEQKDAQDQLFYYVMERGHDESD